MFIGIGPTFFWAFEAHFVYDNPEYDPLCGMF